MSEGNDGKMARVIAKINTQAEMLEECRLAAERDRRDIEHAENARRSAEEKRVRILRERDDLVELLLRQRNEITKYLERVGAE